MAHGFQVGIGSDPNSTYFFSKSGPNPSAGVNGDPNGAVGDPNQFRGGQTGTIIIGTGSWQWPILSNPDYTVQHHCLADGVVKLLGDRTSRFQYIGKAGFSMNDFSLEQFAGYHFQTTAGTADYNRCVIKVLPDFGLTENSTFFGTVNFTDCILFNVNFTAVCLAGGNFNRCLFFNCTFGAAALTMNYCYIDPLTSAWATSATRNNVDPGCNTDNSKGLRIGSATVYSRNTPQGISALPGFNAQSKEDFTLRKDSAHIINGIGPTHLRYANTFFMEFLGGTSEPATISNLRLAAANSAARVPLSDISTGANSFEVNSQGGVVIIPNSNGDGFATLTTGRIPFSDIPLEMTVMRIIAGLNFDTDFPGTEAQVSLAAPHIFNNNVPDYSNGVSGSATRNPNRLSYRMRWSTLTDPNVSDPSHWVTGATFVEFGWNQKPQFNQATLIGNGDPTFNLSAAANVYCRFYQMQVRLRNNYYSK